MEFDILTKQILKETEITHLIPMGIDTVNIYASVQSSTDEMYEVLKRKHVKCIKWAPHALAFWDIKLNDYFKIVFPHEVTPKVEGDIIFKMNTYVNINFTIPTLSHHSHVITVGNEWKTSYGAFIGSGQVSADPEFMNFELKYQDRTWPLVEFWEKFGQSIIPMVIRWTYPSSFTIDKPNGNFELFRQDLLKAFKHYSNPSNFFISLEAMGLLDYYMPELAANRGCLQDPRYHDDDVLDHLYKTVDASINTTTDPFVQLAALFHDIGKHTTRKEINGEG